MSKVNWKNRKQVREYNAARMAAYRKRGSGWAERAGNFMISISPAYWVMLRKVLG